MAEQCLQTIQSRQNILGAPFLSCGKCPVPSMNLQTEPFLKMTAVSSKTAASKNLLAVEQLMWCVLQMKL